MRRKTKTWLIVIGILLVIGLIGSIGKNKEPDVRISQEETVTAAPTASARPSPTPKATATPVPDSGTAPALVALEPTQPEASGAADRSAPAAEPSPSPSPGAQELDYVLNTNTMKFHRPSCSSVKDIKESNRQDVRATRDDVIARGFQPCGKCKP